MSPVAAGRYRGSPTRGRLTTYPYICGICGCLNLRTSTVDDAAGTPSLRRGLMDKPRKLLDIGDRGRWQDAVTEVEDMSAAAARARQDVTRADEKAIPGSQQQRGIEIALNRAVRPNALPRFVERDSPISPKHISSRLSHRVQNRPGGDTKVNRWHAVSLDGTEDLLRVGQDKLAIVVDVQCADPRIEHLDGVDAGIDLRHEIIGHHAGESIGEAMPGGRIAVHQTLRERTVVRVAAFYRVRRQGEGGARESNQGDSARELMLDQSNRIQGEGQGFSGIGRSHRLDILCRSDGTLDRGAFAFDKVERNAHGLEWQQEIGKEDRRIDLDSSQRLQRDLGGKLRRAAQLQQRIALSQRSIFRHVAPGLPHEPDWRFVHGFAPACAKESTVAQISRGHQKQSSRVLYYRVCFKPGGPVSPILVRPVREQFEHDRVIRVLQARYKRKHEVVVNPGSEQNASVEVGAIAMYPDLLLFSQERGRKLQGTVEVETTESINTLEAMAEWAQFSRLRAPFYLYVPANTVDTVRRLCTEHQVNVAEIWTYHMAVDQIRFTMVHRSAEAAALAARAPQNPDRRSATKAAKPPQKAIAPKAAKPAKPAKPGKPVKPAKKAAKASKKPAPKKAAKAVKRR